jgi:mannose-6-phosphate isomerase-like protein (cupin superfamily)
MSRGFYNDSKNQLKKELSMNPVAFTTVLNDSADYQPLLLGSPHTHGMRAGRVYLMPGQECGEHTTGGHEEMLVFLAGVGVAEVESGEPMKVGRGEITYIPPQTKHNIRNTGSEPLVYTYCVAPVARQA